MRGTKNVQRSLFVLLTLGCVASAWWGCSATGGDQTSGSAGSQTTSSGTGGNDTTTSGSSGTAGAGGVGLDGGGAGGVDDAGSCTSISESAQRVQVDIVFLIDRSQSMSGQKWNGTTSALKDFFSDPASAKLGAGLEYFPNNNASPCIPEDYEVLSVPIGVLPANSFALTNSLPADATGGSTPTWGALKGALSAATAYQDAHPKDKVILVLATDGGPNSCPDNTIEGIANLAKSARNYNGVQTYVIGVQGADIPSINKIAAAGGTGASYDITNDISQFAATIADIRSKALGCDFQIPAPPNGKELDPDEVNFTYTPQGSGMEKLILRADDLADCNGKPGWYYDNNLSPTKIILCPASCATVQADLEAVVNVLFGCKSKLN